MAFKGFIRKVCITLAVLVLLLVLIIFTIVLRALPLKKSIPPYDKVWTSDVYTEHFHNPNQWRYIETFVYQTFVPYDQIRPQLADDKNVFAAEVFRLLWDARNAYGGIYAPSIEGPTIGSIGGTESIRAEVVHRSDMEVAFTITSVFNGYEGGLETVEVEMLETGAMIELKYMWHNPHLPSSWSFQWCGVYIQLMGRSMWLRHVVAGVTKIAATAEVVDHLHRDL